MNGRGVVGRGAVAVWFVVGCAARPTDRSQDENASLGGEVAVRVAVSEGASRSSESIPLSLVVSVADAQHVSARDAAKRVLDDEIAASAARRKGLDVTTPTSWRLTSARAGFTVHRFTEEAKGRGQPTPQEVDTLSERHWLEVARPPSVRVIHAIVMRPPDSAAFPRAVAVADELRRAVLSAQDEGEFEKSAKALQTDLDVRVESLPPFTDQGWITEGGGRMDSAFAKGAFDISTVGGTSPVIESSFGWHVIRLRERIPEHHLPLEARRVAFASEAYTMRARELLESRLKVLRTDHHVEVSPAAEQLMRSVSIPSPASGTSKTKVEAPQP